ncbi:MAG: PadR family transcriptional regulator [Nitrososphaerales archaeon]
MQNLIINVSREIRYKCVRSFLDFIILGLIRKKPISGYDVITYIYDRFQILLSPGTVYPTLNTLEEQGLVSSFADSRKKLYTLTKKGENVINQMAIEYLKCYVQLDTLSRLLLGSKLTDSSQLI